MTTANANSMADSGVNISFWFAVLSPLLGILLGCGFAAWAASNDTFLIRNADVYPVVGAEMKGVSLLVQDGTGRQVINEAPEAPVRAPLFRPQALAA